MISDFLKKTQTLIASLISSIVVLLFILPNITRSQVTAVYDPGSVPNNKFGVHIISASVDEASPAATLVNSGSGDWGYITVLIKSSERDSGKWQAFFNDLRRRHLIPVVRLATQPEGPYWKKPYDKEEIAWADFLDSLIWPTKNRYVTVYNEVNHGTEWGNSVDPLTYAQVLDQTITALKAKSPDFFILNAGFDASSPQKPPNYMDEYQYLLEMENSVPGIFNKLDGWSSHSYPQPGFAGSPLSSGRGTVQTWQWELATLRSLGVSKNLPVFITETGWKHSEGIEYDKSLPDSETVGEYFSYAFQQVWRDPQIVAVTPFLLNYQEHPFDHFSFKKITGEKQNAKILGAQFPEYYPQFEVMMNMPKVAGLPLQDKKASLIHGSIPHSLVGEFSYSIPLTFKNTGQSIWNERNIVSLIGDYLTESAKVAENIKVEPGNEYTFNLKFKTPKSGSYKIRLNLYDGNDQFNSPPLEYTFEIKSPVRLNVKAGLSFESDFSGLYHMEARSEQGGLVEVISLDENGEVDLKEIKELYPDLEYDITLKRPFYKAKTVKTTLKSGDNSINFKELDLDWVAILTNPVGYFRQ